MSLKLLAAASLLAALLAGCITGPAPAAETPNLPVGGPALPGPLYSGVGRLFAGPALYDDPQNTPHPGFNWPTLAHPAVGAAVPKYWAPIEPIALPAAIRDLEHLVQAPKVPSGAGIAIFGSLVVVPGFGQPTSIVDISDPLHPNVLSQIKPQEGLGTHRGAAFIPYPDGRLVTVISTGAGIDVWDLSDPTAPTALPPLTDVDGKLVRSHKVGVIPGTPIVVNAASGGGASSDPDTSPAITKMWDLSDPTKAVPLPDFKNGYSCHHVYFWNNLALNKTRGVCAGIQYTQIWDTTDPYHPKVIVSVPFGSGGTPLDATDRSAQIPLSISHYAGLSRDGKVLLMGDESGGGSTPPGCVVRADIPGVGAVSMPIGAVWFYDVSVETQPKLLGWYSASQADKATTGGDAPTSCTAHHGRLIPHLERDMLAMSFYGSGVLVIDFTDVRSEGGGLPSTVAQWADHSDTWETWYYQGYLFTGDLNRGMDVLKLV
ncbi:MAG TPA: hypothetical protein VM286_03095 [Candidatus Thermoplasmatota archaeon]|nr:hypothetical protein [Candidatus Thermoplasmatota archaeon]